MLHIEKCRSVLKDIASIPKDNPDLLIAQYKAFTFQLPLMYVILVINTWGVAVTLMLVAPRWMTIHIPVVMTIIAFGRVLTWLRRSKHKVDSDAALKALVRTNRLSSFIALAFTLWGFVLFGYGDAYLKAHVAFYMAVTVIGVIFCMMHLRPAAFKVAFIVNGSFVVFFALSGDLVFVTIAINTALVSATMLAIVLVHYRDFTGMVSALAENLRLANIDSPPGLPNRRAIFAHLGSAYAIAQSEGTCIAVGTVNLDGFKPLLRNL